MVHILHTYDYAAPGRLNSEDSYEFETEAEAVAGAWVAIQAMAESAFKECQPVTINKFRHPDFVVGYSLRGVGTRQLSFVIRRKK